MNYAYLQLFYKIFYLEYTRFSRDDMYFKHTATAQCWNFELTKCQYSMHNIKKLAHADGIFRYLMHKNQIINYPLHETKTRPHIIYVWKLTTTNVRILKMKITEMYHLLNNCMLEYMNFATLVFMLPFLLKHCFNNTNILQILNQYNNTDKKSNIDIYSTLIFNKPSRLSKLKFLKISTSLILLLPRFILLWIHWYKL